MTYEIFFGGVGATLLGTLVGALLGAWLTYGFQQKLLNQQLAFQKKQGDEEAILRIKMLEQLRQAIASAGAEISSAARRPPPAQRIDSGRT